MPNEPFPRAETKAPTEIRDISLQAASIVQEDGSVEISASIEVQVAYNGEIVVRRYEFENQGRTAEISQLRGIMTSLRQRAEQEVLPE